MDQQPNQQQPFAPDTTPPQYDSRQTVTVPPVAAADMPAPVSVETPQEQQQQSQPQQQGYLEWQASEYIEHEKTHTWFIVLGVVTFVLLAVAIFVMRTNAFTMYTFAILIVVMAVAVGFWARRPAMQMYYRLDSSGITINNKPFPFSAFRAFGVLQESGMPYVMLLPNKRFTPAVNVHFPQELGEQIVDVFGAAMPMENIKPDFIDILMNRLHF